MAFVSSFSGLGVKASATAKVCSTRARTAKWTMSEGGKGFGGGEATRDPEPTVIDTSDPKAKQKAIHPAETYADYQARKAREAEEEKNKK